MKKIFTLTLILIGFVFAYNPENELGIALDVGGPYTIVQTEADIRLLDKENHYIGASAGLGMFINAMSIPLGMQYRYGDKHQLETAAYFVIMSSSNGAVYNYSIKFGYRLNFSNAFFHIYVSPLINKTLSVQPWAGLGFGFYLQ